MPRGPRLDYQGAVQHVIARGIERRKIFRSARDRLDLLGRLEQLVFESRAGLYAWVLMPNHIHLLLRTGSLPLSRFMQRLLGSYACTFNRRYNRAGHLFQNRFKNTLVEEEPYFLELVRYIHLNPVRSQLSVTLESLDRYRWTGHSVLLGEQRFDSQDTAFVLGQFGDTVRRARSAYREFVGNGLRGGAGPDLEGGGLRRSAGGWEFVPKLARGREGWAYDERILGRPEFVEAVLGGVRQEVSPNSLPDDPRLAFPKLCERIARRYGVSSTALGSRTVRRDVLKARALVCHVTVRRWGFTAAEVARLLGVSENSIGRALRRFESLPEAKSRVAELLAD